MIDIIACKLKSIAKLYDRIVGKEYREEMKKFKLEKSKNILHVGCGSYPITAMTLADMYDAKIVTIDNDEKSIERANKYLDRKKLNGKIKALHGNGINYPLEDFDTIIVSGCSVPIAKALEHAFKNAKSGTKIIARTSLTDVELIIEKLDPPQNITILDKKYNYIAPTIYWDSILIGKN